MVGGSLEDGVFSLWTTAARKGGPDAALFLSSTAKFTIVRMQGNETSRVFYEYFAWNELRKRRPSLKMKYKHKL